MPITGDWDHRITRRTLLRTGGSFAAGLTLAGTLAARSSAQASFASDPFALGVASGDPTAHSVVLWTRIAPEPLVGGGLPDEPYRVRYELARDEDFRHVVRQGDVVAVADEAHSVRVELDQLPPAHEYFYRFEVGEMGVGDNWDGYVAERQLLLDWMVEHRTPNPMILTGDSHLAWVRNVPPDIHRFDAPPVATELMGTSISTNGDPRDPVTFVGMAGNPHILLRDNRRGYVRCSLTRDAWTSEFRIVPTRERGLAAATLATVTVEDGRAGGRGGRV